MRRYSPEDEQKVRLRDALRDWTKAGLLEPDQESRLQTELAVPLRRTGLMLRIGLALFTFVIVGASVGLVFFTLNPRSETSVGVILGVLGVVSLAAADAVVARFHFYRHGVEEALAVSAVALLGPAASLLALGATNSRLIDPCVAFGLVVAAVVSAGIYRRFGFQYAWVGAMVCAALAPAPIGSLSRPVQHLLAIAVFAVGFVVARAMRAGAREEQLQEDAEMFQAASLAGAYLAINIYASVFPWPGQIVVPWFKWATYIATWLLPIWGLQVGIRERARRVVDASLALAVLTLMTNKAYLGLPGKPWDPMLLGAVLVGVALFVRRWLSSGPDGARAGYTAAQLLESEGRALQLASLASATVQPGPIGESSPTHTEFDGGRSGGAGAGADF